MRVIAVPNVNSDRYLYDLRAAYSGQRIFDPDFALQRDPYIYEKMLRDPTIRQCLSERLRTVAGGSWSVEPAEEPTPEEELAASVVKGLLREIKAFQASRVNLAKFAWEGQRFAAIEGGRRWRAFGDKAEREWWVPTRLRDIGKRRVRVWREDGRIVRRLEKITENGVRTDKAIEFPPDRIMMAVYDDEESRIGWGRGLGDTCYWYFYAKWKLLEEGLAAAEKWAQGIPVVKADVASIGDTNQDSVAIRDQIIDAVKNARAQGVIAVGKEDEVEILHGSGTETETIIKMMLLFDDGIRLLLTGAKLPSGGGQEIGSLARAKEEADTSEGVYQLDSAILDETITEELIGPVWRLNTENLREVGIEDARMPTFSSADERLEDHEVNSRIVTAALAARMPLKKDEAYRKMGLTPPTVDDEKAGNVLVQEPVGVGDEFGGDREGESGSGAAPEQPSPGAPKLSLAPGATFAKAPER